MLFLDIVRSTRIADDPGEVAWNRLVAGFRWTIRTELKRHGIRQSR